jgi:hypothetical protein
MGFNAQDSYNLNQAKNVGISIQYEHFQDCDVIRMTLSSATDMSKISILSEAIMSVSRSMNDGYSTTVWLEVQFPRVPEGVYDAVKSCIGFGVGLIITCSGKSTHLPGELLETSLVEAVQAATRDGRVWHPFIQKLVEARQQV